MIIKKNKNDNSQNLGQKAVSEQKILPQEIPAPVIRERQEKRRGDRRRGYRRIDERNLISRAYEEANEIKEQAAKEGFKYGLDQSKEEIKKLKAAIIEFLESKEDAFHKISPEISFIALKVAEKIIKAEISLNPDIVLNIVSDALKQIGKDETNIIIKINPSHSGIIRENLPHIFPYGNNKTKITVVNDKDVESGSCIVETNNGMVDARFSTQIEILTKAFEAGI